MKITIKTEYENVTEEFLADWLKRLCYLPQLQGVTEELREKGTAVFASNDPSGSCTARTEYSIEK